MFEHIEPYAGDPIFGLNDAFLRDARAHKVNLTIGIYFDDEGRLPVLGCVRAAEAQLLAESAPKSYLPMEGLAACRAGVQQLLFGADSQALAEGRVVTVQTVGSSGGLRVAGDFIKRWLPGAGVWVSDPTWDNHRSLLEACGLAVQSYPYYDSASGGLREQAMFDAIAALPRGSVVLLHACCHNPTGVDLSQAQWQRLAPLLRERGLLPFVDLAYQGYGDGIDADAFGVRELARAGVTFFVANSFSKSMSLYGERAGALSVVCGSPAEAELVLGQMKATVRQNYSSPPLHAGAIVARVLGDAALRASWETDVAAMRQRILEMRRALHAVLSRRLPNRSFDYFLTQRGMFSYTGMTPEQVERLREQHAVYILRSGRMCITGLRTTNVEQVAQAMAAVLA